MSVVGEWPLRVYYEDTDHGGGVYYANYLKFFERGRTELLRTLGFEQDDLLGREGLLFVVQRVEVDYRRPAVFNDALRVVTEVGDLGRARADFHQRIFREGESEPLCQGRVRVACVGAEDFRPRPIPQTVRQALGFGAS
ncbi:MAG: tol-pal system-associated acyl-CoA thioesterase [Thiohalospira sp.]|uniref:tol-pal system-associated acyl-CoA thioesterase n=1 Tax=Thiohalorhabdus sp. TaxID=3094134 RepID=UPI003981327F